MVTLASLYKEHSSKVSDKWTIYIGQYEEKFKSYKDEKIRILEIGIQNGGSLEIYGKYFQNAELILGCDIDEKCLELTYQEPNIQVIVGDATDEITYKKIAVYSEFDIIIEDGSHTSSDIVKTFCKYFSRLKDGGVFIIEDLHCSYWKEFDGGLFHPLSAINFFKRLVDVINQEHWGISKKRGWILKLFSLNYGVDLDALQLENIHSLEFVNSMCFIKKKIPTKNQLGNRIIAGSIASVHGAVLNFGKGEYGKGEYGVPSQYLNSWSNRELTPDEELISCKRKIKELEEKNRVIK